VIDSYVAAGDTAVRTTKVVGHRWSAPSFEIRDFLAGNAVPYRWLSVDEAEGRRLLDAAGVGPERLPLVVTADGDALVAPNITDVTEAVGLSSTPATDFYDLVVVGGGPAGLGAAVYGASEGLRTLLVEREATGGQAGQSSRIENYLGFPDGVSGAQLTDRARRQATKFGAEILTARDVTGLRARGPARDVVFRDGNMVAAHAVVIATGVSYRDLDVPGAGTLTGRGVYYGSASTEAADCVDADVYIVGGANSAGQAALFFCRVAKDREPGRASRLAPARQVALLDRAGSGDRQHHGPVGDGHRQDARRQTPRGGHAARHVSIASTLIRVGCRTTPTLRRTPMAR